MIVVSYSGGGKLAKNLAKLLRVSYSQLFLEKFPDGELHLRFPRSSYAGQTVVIVQSLAPQPNERLVELLLATRTAKELGAKKVIVVAPYLAYARQDVRFKPGEVVSGKIVNELIRYSGADEFYTVASHLHRVRDISQLFSIPSKDVLIPQEMAKWVKRKVGGAGVVVIGPDGESLHVVKPVAELLGCKYDVFKKKRFSGTRIKHIALPCVDVKGKDVVILDDIVSTGSTVIEAAKILKKMGAKSVSCACVHLMSETAGKKLLQSGIKFFAASNTIESKYSVLDAAPALAAAITRRY